VVQRTKNNAGQERANVAFKTVSDNIHGLVFACRRKRPWLWCLRGVTVDEAPYSLGGRGHPDRNVPEVHERRARIQRDDVAASRSR